MRATHINWQIIRKLKQASSITMLALLVSLVFPVAATQAAGSATLTIVPATTTYNNTDTFSLTIHESSTDQVNAVEADLLYDASKLDFVSLDGNSGAFGLVAVRSGGAGKVNFSAATASAVTGDQIVAVVTFTAKVGSGTTAITFDPTTSAVVRLSDSQNVWNGSTAGATVNFIGATSGTTTTTTTTATTSTAKTKTTAATTAKTTPAATPTTTVAAHVVPITYSVAIKVTDDKGVIVKNALVTLDTKSTHTDPSGVASFTGITSGVHTVTATVGTKKVSQSITVAASNTALNVQEFGVKVAGSKTTNLIWIIALLVALFAISGGGITLGQVLTKHHRTHAAQAAMTQAPAAATKTDVADINPTGQVFYPGTNDSTANPEDNSNKEDTNA